MAEPLVVPNRMKEKLARNEVVTTISIRMVQHVNIASMVDTLGFDALFIDMEHSSMSADAVSQICSAALGIGITPLVRVLNTDPGTVAGVLDGGALGVIAPQVGSAAEVRKVVAAAKYPPLGERSVSSTIPHLRFRTYPLQEALPALNEATMVIAMLESASGLDDVDAIAATEGVDVLLIGSNDLSADLGIPGQYDHERAVEAYHRVIGACLEHGKHAGLGGISLPRYPDLVEDLVSRGLRYVSSSTDVGFFMSAGREWMQQAQKLKSVATP